MVKGIVFASSVVVVCSSLIAATAAQELEEHAEQIQILQSTELRAWCIIGAILGAWIMITAFEDNHNNARVLSAKFLSSAAAGLVFTPLLIHYTNLPKTVDIIAGVSTLVSIFAIKTLDKLGPSVIKFFRHKLGDTRDV